MKIFALLLSLLFVLSAVAQGDVPIVHTLGEQPKTRCLNPQYLVFSSKNAANRKLPLLIYLHGSGGRGNDIGKIRGQAMRVWRGITKFGKEPCILVAPQCQKSTNEPLSTWIPEDLNILLKHLKATLPIDHHRIYLTGNSMGGYGSWVWGAHNPEHFAAIAPIAGGIGQRGPKDVTPELTKWATNLAKVPVYAFVGAKDKVVPAERSERMIAAIRKAGGKNARIKVYPNEGHGARQVVFSTSEFYDWMFSQRTGQP